jgi:heme-degrading monooxygenase HmoA
MVSVLRLRAEAPVGDLLALRDVLAARPGCLGVELGRGVEEPVDVVLVSRWADLGSCRRGIGSSDVRLAGMALIVDAGLQPVYDVL